MRTVNGRTEIDVERILNAGEDRLPDLAVDPRASPWDQEQKTGNRGQEAGDGHQYRSQPHLDADRGIDTTDIHWLGATLLQAFAHIIGDFPHPEGLPLDLDIGQQQGDDAQPQVDQDRRAVADPRSQSDEDHDLGDHVEGEQSSHQSR